MIYWRDIYYYWLLSGILDQRWYLMGQQGLVEIRISQFHQQAYIDVLPLWVERTAEDLTRLGILL